MDRENILKTTFLLKELGYIPRLPVSPDDIVKMKTFSGRSQDLSDIEMLKKVRKYMEEKHG